MSFLAAWFVKYGGSLNMWYFAMGATLGILFFLSLSLFNGLLVSMYLWLCQYFLPPPSPSPLLPSLPPPKYSSFIRIQKKCLKKCKKAFFASFDEFVFQALPRTNNLKDVQSTTDTLHSVYGKWVLNCQNQARVWHGQVDDFCTVIFGNVLCTSKRVSK